MDPPNGPGPWALRMTIVPVRASGTPAWRKGRANGFTVPGRGGSGFPGGDEWVRAWSPGREEEAIRQLVEKYRAFHNVIFLYYQPFLEGT